MRNIVEAKWSAGKMKTCRVQTEKAASKPFDENARQSPGQTCTSTLYMRLCETAMRPTEDAFDAEHKTCTHSKCDVRRHKTKTHISSFHYTIKSTHLWVQQQLASYTLDAIFSNEYVRRPPPSPWRVVVWLDGCGRTHMCALVRCLIGFGHNLHRDKRRVCVRAIHETVYDRVGRRGTQRHTVVHRSDKWKWNIILQRWRPQLWCAFDPDGWQTCKRQTKRNSNLIFASLVALFLVPASVARMIPSKLI